MSGTVCCYKGCRKSYSTDKEVSFFPFPDDPKRRKKWMQSCGNKELENLSERQLRRQRICSDHFPIKSFLRPETRSGLNDNAVPVFTKPGIEADHANMGKGKRSTGPQKNSAVEDSKVSKSESAKGSDVKSPEAEDPKQGKAKKPPVSQKNTASTEVLASKSEPAKPSEVLPSEEDSPKKSTGRRSAGLQKTRAAAADPKVSKSESVVSTEVQPSEVDLPKQTRLRKSPVAQKSTAAIVASKSEPAKPAAEVQSTEEDLLKSPPAKRTKISVSQKVNKTPDSKVSKSESVTSTDVQPSETEAAHPKQSKVQKSPASQKSTAATDVKTTKSEASKPKEVKLSEEEHPEKPTAKRGKLFQKANKTADSKVSKSESAMSTDVQSSDITATDPKQSKAKKSPVSQKRTATADAQASKSDPSKPKEVKLSEEDSPKKPTAKRTKPFPKANKPTDSKVSKSESVISTEIQTSETDHPKKTKVKKSLVSQKANKAEIQEPNSGTGKLKQVAPLLDSFTQNGDEASDDDYDMYYDREFEERYYEEDVDVRTDREFERFHSSLKKFLQLSGKWTIGGVQWDPQGKRKVIIVSEPEISPNGRPLVKRCLQFFEDKQIRVFVDQMDMTDVFGMTCYAEKEDVAALISRVSEASSCCGVPEMVADDVTHFPNAKRRSTMYFDAECPGVIPNDSYEAICTACKQLRELVLQNRENEKQRLKERRIRSQEKNFQHPFGQALYSMFNDLVDETDPTKPKKKRTKETFFRKFLTDTRYKVNGGASRTERIYVEKPISVDSVSASFQDIVSKLGFCLPNSQKGKTPGGGMRPTPTNSAPRPTRVPANMMKIERKLPVVEHILPFTPGSSFTLDDGQEYELIGEVDSSNAEFLEVKPTPAQQQFEIIEVDDDTLAKLTMASGKNNVVVLPEAASNPSNLQITRIDANDPNLSQILKAINTSHGFKVT